MELSDDLMAKVGKVTWGSVFPNQFLRQVADSLEVLAPGREQQLLAQIRERAADLAREDADLAVDPQGEGLLRTAGTMIATFEVLRRIVGDDDKTVYLVAHFARGVARRSTKAVVDVALKLSKDPIDTVENAGGALMGLFGDGFDWSAERGSDANGQDCYELSITRCFFCDMADRHATELRPAFCAWDGNYLEEFDALRWGVYSDRPMTIATGAARCSFKFSRASDPFTENSDVGQVRPPA